MESDGRRCRQPLKFRRRDPLTAVERSERMAKVRSRYNRSTELVVRVALRRAGIRGWRRHASLPGRPDFYFRRAKLAVFVDGCFWHGCPFCSRRLPVHRRAFWLKKLTANRKRDDRVRCQLLRLGCRTMRIWEHELRYDAWIKRLQARLSAQFKRNPKSPRHGHRIQNESAYIG
jgi:DNA mismatch endonuclease (patch repair protein)